MAIASTNPTTGELLKTYAPLNDGEIETCLAKAATAFASYRKTAFDQRAGWLLKVSDRLKQDRERCAQMMTLEMGKPITEAIAEVEKSAWVCRYYAEHGAQFLADELVDTDASQSFIRYQPLGPILAVMPWNFPFWQVFRFAAPALMAGNVGLLKHASNVPQCALAIAEIFAEAGFADGVFQTLLIPASRVAPLMADPRIKAATLTGSEPAGMSLAQAAGQQIKKTVLELGGSDPCIVLDSADIGAAVTTGLKSRMINNGQSCIAAKRFIVQASIYDEFAEQLIHQMQGWNLGNPLNPETQLGPLATQGILDELGQQVEQAIAQGATLHCGGQVLQGTAALLPELRQGYFYPPTLLSDIGPEHPAFSQEFFGPVALLFRVNTLDDAIQLANATPFGLGASAWTTDPHQRDRLLDELEAGAVFINGLVKSDPRLPFGGIKRSGYGRELGRVGIQEFVNLKTVWIA
ncbi:NAD-dependent succinate-semialdehyde dehydrogenase [Candidatus Synechococcus calcipolaris G9]|uniref:NAD-dependent succinate-semialdehyde dehydrogenase n=1 Tax=Candidatus Synechococcus calcipolaris G9 TaxID=1497997 RepID=A0ABT6F0Q8_9SYNE|nr:NAD-dependent succinate-semialdehyde dehydrogenase [Candidatus Synechococcus calcipolaris]MDG2991411.1 NAD-dependent succinate-semialdehyde dehydrogenase [Candidatus Synechococcus calcipolaris G9]